MLIDESKMAVVSSFSFLNLRKQHTNLKLKLPFKIETQTTLTEQKRSTKTSYDWLIQIVKDLIAADQIQVATTHYRHRPIQIANYMATQANHRYTNLEKLPSKLISKITALRILEWKTTRLFILQQKLSNIPKQSSICDKKKVYKLTINKF